MIIQPDVGHQRERQPEIETALQETASSRNWHSLSNHPPLLKISTLHPLPSPQPTHQMHSLLYLHRCPRPTCRLFRLQAHQNHIRQLRLIQITTTRNHRIQTICRSNFIADGHPLITQVIPSPKYLQIISVWNQCLDVLINFLWLLTLTSAIAEDHIASDSFVYLGSVSFDSDQTSLFGVLKIVTMSFGDLSINSLFDPGDGIYNFIPPLFHQPDCEGILCVDCPDDQHSVFLQLGHRYSFDKLVAKGVVLDSDPSGGLGSGQLPWRVHHDDVEVALGELQLLFDKLIKVKSCDICTYRDRIFADIRFNCIAIQVHFNSVSSRRNCCLQLFNFAFTELSSACSYPYAQGRRSTIYLESNTYESSGSESFWQSQSLL